MFDYRRKLVPQPPKLKAKLTLERAVSFYDLVLKRTCEHLREFFKFDANYINDRVKFEAAKQKLEYIKTIEFDTSLKEVSGGDADTVLSMLHYYGRTVKSIILKEK